MKHETKAKGAEEHQKHLNEDDQKERWNPERRHCGFSHKECRHYCNQLDLWPADLIFMWTESNKKHNKIINTYIDLQKKVSLNGQIYIKLNELTSTWYELSSRTSLQGVCGLTAPHNCASLCNSRFVSHSIWTPAVGQQLLLNRMFRPLQATVMITLYQIKHRLESIFVYHLWKITN